LAGTFGILELHNNTKMPPPLNSRAFFFIVTSIVYVDHPHLIIVGSRNPAVVLAGTIFGGDSYRWSQQGTWWWPFQDKDTVYRTDRWIASSISFSVKTHLIDCNDWSSIFLWETMTYLTSEIIDPLYVWNAEYLKCIRDLRSNLRKLYILLFYNMYICFQGRHCVYHEILLSFNILIDEGRLLTTVSGIFFHWQLCVDRVRDVTFTFNQSDDILQVVCLLWGGDFLCLGWEQPTVGDQLRVGAPVEGHTFDMGPKRLWKRYQNEDGPVKSLVSGCRSLQQVAHLTLHQFIIRIMKTDTILYWSLGICL
jgi:hypothetical protein